mmetsp:Transcript_31576/g.55543  ORF Transcript_31576/g.55543 Transcript_31576/m.55543 type:complete len:608 (+) Transcript_31576:121-1944(+)|eukprot:CAMPEP_0197540824 /NCGR_PEP_ID=MMETSP1318-20131121/66791_1 /TAXON_ID=552666 /ORGANISM="Partenskyella glossopodia, Strain RCC365" /LENGTH=607 /DNA_ID=CAMNT_0043099927 /DNA_START=134 /DNA_END=1957 /DNA_ORIENTATION=+
MPVLSGLLPTPKYAAVDKFDPKDFQFDNQQKRTFKQVPPYLKRKGFRPRVAEDFGDGGAFPEIHTLQYPLNMGRKDRAADAVTPLRVDAQGNVKYDMIVHQGVRRGKKVFSQLSDLVAHDSDSDEDLAKPDEEEIQKLAEKTQMAMGKIVSKKMMAARPTHIGESATERHEPVFIRYTPSQAKADSGHNSGAQQRIIKLQEMPKDPLEPPKFRVKKLPPRPPSPPVPVMHSPPRKITAEDQASWKIPPCISNWKNIKGYTIPLDKRLAADGRGLKEVTINDKFATLSESLYIAERNAREDIQVRAQMMKNLMQGKKKIKEEEYRKAAMKAREEGLARAEPEDEDEIEAREIRDKLRKERRREIKRDLRMEARMTGKESKIKRGGTKSGFGRDDDRDISEKIALGQNVSQSRDSMFDQRLFNQDAGLSNGFGAEDSYNLYSKPLMKGSSASQLYRPPKDLTNEVNADRQMKSILETGTSKFRPDRGFKGADDQVASSSRGKPVEFEKDQADPFNLGSFMDSVKNKKKGKGNALDSIGKQGFMKASGGSSSRDKDDYGGVHPDRMNQMEGFKQASSSSSSSRKRERSRERDRDRRRRDDSRDRDRRRRR